MERTCKCQEHGDDGIPQEQWEAIDAIVAKYKGKPGSLIPVLEDVQGVTGFLPTSVQRRIATGLGVPLSQVYGVVTFYSFFTMVPRGRHQIRVCLGTACHVRGSRRVLEELSHNLDIGPGECTPDREFSIDTVRCLGACGLAPVMVVDEETHKQVKAVRVNQILDQYKADAPAVEES